MSCIIVSMSGWVTVWMSIYITVSMCVHYSVNVCVMSQCSPAQDSCLQSAGCLLCFALLCALVLRIVCQPSLTDIPYPSLHCFQNSFLMWWHSIPELVLLYRTHACYQLNKNSRSRKKAVRRSLLGSHPVLCKRLGTDSLNQYLVTCVQLQSKP